MDHLLACRLVLALLTLSCHALRSGCDSAVQGLLFASVPAAAAATAAKARAPSSSRHDDRLRDALDAAAQRVGQALAALTAAPSVGQFSAGAPSSSSPALAAAAHEDCLELLREAHELVTGAKAPGAARDDALTWLSAALTNHDTCADSLAEAGISGDDDVEEGFSPILAAARGNVRNSLAMYASSAPDQAAPAPVANNETYQDACGFPRWLPSTDRRLLLAPAAALKDGADIVVAQDGTGTHANITDAVRAAPECSDRRTVIHVKAGRYDEIVRVGSKKTNLVFIGDGQGATVVTGGLSFADNITTFRTATFAASGSGFMMLDMTVENRAGPMRRQAVALRVSADRAVVHRCTVLGYQDTLYAHSNRQFYRDCDVYGTVDFVFGNAAAVLQRCSLLARAPLPWQKNTVTAQGRCDPCQDTGLVLHACRVLPAPDLVAPWPAPSPAVLKAATAAAPAPNHHAPTYLGRPWKLYSRVVVMMSYIGPHVPAQGWLPWNTSTYALDTLYYGEYMNNGPGAGVTGRVAWPGHRVISDAAEAERFTVAQFIAGTSWLPATGVSFEAGLSE